MGKSKKAKAADFFVDVYRERLPGYTIAGVGYAGSFTHLVKLGENLGQPLDTARTTAAVIDLMCMFAANERYRDSNIERETSGWVSWPTLLLAVAITITVVANWATGRGHGLGGHMWACIDSISLLLVVLTFERRRHHKSKHCKAVAAAAADVTTDRSSGTDDAPAPPVPELPKTSVPELPKTPVLELEGPPVSEPDQVPVPEPAAPAPGSGTGSTSGGCPGPGPSGAGPKPHPAGGRQTPPPKPAGGRRKVGRPPVYLADKREELIQLAVKIDGDRLAAGQPRLNLDNFRARLGVSKSLAGEIRREADQRRGEQVA